MNGMIENGIIAAVIAFAAAFVVLRVVKTFRSKRPSCCSGGNDKASRRSAKKAACPHCAGNSVASSAEDSVASSAGN